MLKIFTELAAQSKTYDELKSLFREAFKNLSGEQQRKPKQVYDMRKSKLEYKK